jgi:hypothetical protein
MDLDFLKAGFCRFNQPDRAAETRFFADFFRFFAMA